MWSTFVLIFLALCIGIGAWLVFLWAVKSGQYDDVEGPKYRMLDDEDEMDENKFRENGGIMKEKMREK